jgi:NitT/TauT family transport system substrate-binding protein
MRRRTVLQSSALFAIGALSTNLLGGCGNQAADVKSGTGTSSTKPLRVGLIPWLGWHGTYLADLKGLFKAEGVTVDQKVFQTVTEVNTALLANQIDLAWLVAVDLLVLTAQAPDLKNIMVSDYSGDVDAILGRGISGPADLKGKTIAREDIPYEVVFLGQYLQRAGLTAKDVKILSMTVPDGSAAFAAGKVDAVVTYEPFITKAIKEKPETKVLFSAAGTNIIPNSLAGHSKVLEDRREDVMAYMRAVDKGMKFAKDNPKEANEAIAKWTGITADEVADLMTKIKLLDIEANKSIAFNPQNPLNLLDSVESAAKILKSAGKIKKPVDSKTLIDDSLIKAL